MIEKILDSYEKKGEFNEIKFHPQLYSIDFANNTKFDVKLEDNYKTYMIEKNLTLQAIIETYH